MQKMIQKIQLKFAELKLEQIYNIFIILIIVIILGLACIATYRPIQPQQLNTVYKISQQASYVHTQEMALALLAQDQIYIGQYLKLLMALQMERKKAKHLPAMSVDQY
ncbi:hypothetical protein [Acinetobacter equi]|uniref:Uncharacterized protein n=1 Tax=Acinetobacter equi TaxID=1324350 RepID=A0A0N9VRF5_9GAMM|nr:hypothetical protein [Acinetobacter equi]ALH95938.1 hypothetical protein AOY20_10555 [Acinetobacter equi]